MALKEAQVTKIDILRNPDKTTELTITREVFKGATTYEYRGLTDAYTDEEIRAIAENPAAGSWRWYAAEYLVNK